MSTRVHVSLLIVVVLGGVLLGSASAAQAAPYPGFTQDPTPFHPTSSLGLVEATSATGAWAVVSDEDPDDSAVVQRTSTGWQVNNGCPGIWQDLAAVNDKDVWVAGAPYLTDKKRWISVGHWNGSDWHCYRPKVASDTLRLHARPGDVWVSVSYSDGSAPAFAHWHHGQGWEVFTQTCGNQTDCVTGMDSADGVTYAVGRQSVDGDYQAAVWRRCQSCT